MTNPDNAHITLVCDRSGSMDAVRHEAEMGVNALIKEQQEQPGECTILLVDFDTAYHVHHCGPLATCPHYTLTPRGMTALLDAVGRAINETGEMLAALPEHDRPGKVIFAVQTDGYENSSREFTSDRVKAMVAEQETRYGWDFVFLGTGQESWSGATLVGIDNVTKSSATCDAVASTYVNTSAAMTTLRAGGQSAAFASATKVTIDDEGTVQS